MSSGNQGPRDMAKINLRGLVNLDTTQSQWVEAVLADFNTFLSDHASAEKKASGMALSMASHYQDRGWCFFESSVACVGPDYRFSILYDEEIGEIEKTEACISLH